jgi:glycosyltransferase involved in cell wall biosynthesis
MQPGNSEPFTVLILVNRLFEWSQNFITRELTELNEQGTPMYIGARKVQPRDDLSEKEKKLLGKVILLPENPFTPACLVRHLQTKLRNPRAYFRAWRTLFSLGHHRFGKFLRSLVCLFRAAAVAQEVVSKNVTLIHAHFLTAPGETAVYLSKMTGIPYGGTGHAMDLYVDDSGLKGKIAHATYITTCTAANEHFLKTSGIADQAKIHKLYHGIELLPDLPPSTARNPFTFLAVGRLVPKKGYNFLLEACHRLRQEKLGFHCRIIGTGPLETDLKKQAEVLGLGCCVSFEGFVAPNRMGEIYRESHLLVVPSVIDADGDRDGLPNVCLEAMNNGLPIIGSNVAGIPEGVIDGENGWLVPPANVEKLAAAMRQAITHPNPEPMRRAARRMVVENFSLQKNIRDLREIMQTAGRKSPFHSQTTKPTCAE